MEESYRFGFHRFWSVLGVSVLVGLAVVGGLILFIIPGIWRANWFFQAVVAAVATVITLPYGTLVGVLLYLDLRARKEQLTLERLWADLQASAT